tara:strand:- start:544 stop:909 length:366 start_codon:yes stop_codon:yes gene_type:complete
MTQDFISVRSVPVSALFAAQWARRLHDAGYLTVGHVLDATPKALADRLFAVGPVRAAKIRQRAVDYADAVRTAQLHAEFYQVETSKLLDEVFVSRKKETIATIVSLLLIGGLFVLTVWWLR